MFTLVFWKAAADRATRTFAQTLAALIGTGAIGITSLDWRTDLSVSATAALCSILTSITSLSPIVPLTPPAKADPAPAPSTVVVNAPATVAEPAAPAAVPTAPADTPDAAPSGGGLASKLAAITSADPAAIVPVYEPPAADAAAAPAK